MRNLKRRILSIFMTVLMVLSLSGNMVSAQQGGIDPQQNVSNEVKTLPKKENFTKDTNKKEKSYKPNEAIVMTYEDNFTNHKSSVNEFRVHKDANGTISHSSLDFFGEEVSVNETYEFAEKNTAKNSVGTTSLSSSKTTPQVKVSLFTSKSLSTDALVKVIKEKIPNVIAVQPNYIVKAANVDYKNYQWALDNQGQNSGTLNKDINPEDALAAASTDEKVIAVIDTGIDYKHEALQDKMWENKTGVLKGAHGYNFCYSNDDPMDDFGHGTHCAGIIAGNGTGVTGLAKNVKLMALKFLDAEGYGELYDAVAAYDYINRAIDNKVNVVAINNSWTGGEETDIFEKLVNLVGAKGAITVVAASNSHSNNDKSPNYPWSFTSDYMITVAASNEKGELAEFSCYGENSVDIAAPGADILSSVSYDVYNPTIHSGTEQATYSEIYNEFKGTELPAGHKEFNVNIDKQELATDPTLTIDQEENFSLSNDTSGSLNLKVDTDGTNIYGCYWPVTLPKSSTSYYCSAMIKQSYVAPYTDYDGYSEAYYGVAPVSVLETIKQNPGDAMKIFEEVPVFGMSGASPNPNYWSTSSGSTGISESANGEYAFFIMGVSIGKSSYEINLDNFGISKKDLKSTDFGKYDFYNGTSMATPYVTASVAIMRQCYPDLTTVELRNKVAACGRQEKALSGYVRDGRNLDLSYFDKDVCSVTSTSYKDGKFTLKGVGLTKVHSILLNGNPVTISSKEKSVLTFDADNCTNKKLTLEITLTDTSTIKKSLYIPYSEVVPEELQTTENVQPGSIVSDGSRIYCYSRSQYGEYYFGSCNVTDSTAEWTSLPIILNCYIDTKMVEELAGGIANLKSNICYDKGKIYAVAESDLGYYSVSALLAYDTKLGEWNKICDMPGNINESNTEGSCLAVYNGKIYLMGGMTRDKLEVLNTVYSYELPKEDQTANEWKPEANLPEGRAFANADVVNGKMILTMGTVDGKSDLSTTIPAPLLYNNEGWVTSKAQCKASSNKSGSFDDKRFTYYEAAVGVYKKGLAFVGLVTDELGDVFYYNVEKDSFETDKNCSLYSYTEMPEYCGGTTVADKFCFFGRGEQTMIEDEWGDMYLGYGTKIYGIPMDTVNYSVLGDNSFCTYMGTGYYLPGESAEITIMPMEGYAITGYKLNDVVYEGNTITIDSVNKNYTIEPIGYPFASKIMFSQDKYEVVAGKSITISAELMPFDSQDNIQWTVNSDNSSINNGVLKTSLKDAGRELTVTATTENGIFNSCKVQVISTVQSIQLNRQKLVLQQGNAFKLKAIVTPNDAVNADVHYSTSNPAIVMVNDSGDLVGLKPGKATITASTVEKKNIKSMVAYCQVTVAAPVNKVTNVKASSSSNQINLSWNKVSSADGYVVYRYDTKTKKDVQLAVINGGQKTSYSVKQLLGSKGSKLAAGTAYTFRVMAFDKVEGVVFYGSKTSINSCTTPNITSIKGFKNSKKGELKVTWSKVSGITGYQVYISKKAGGAYTLKANIKKAGTDTVTIKGLKKGTWYVKVRTYKVINGKTIYSSFSSIKNKKIK